MSRHEQQKRRLNGLRAALYDWDAADVRSQLAALFSPTATVRLCHPFEDLDGATGLFGQALAPLQQAIPDLERRDYIVIGGPSASDGDWVGCAGYYTGVFQHPWLGIPPTHHQIAMRFHEFYRFDGDTVIDLQAIWDIPEVMIAAGVWPMGPALGREWHVPGPATQDGLLSATRSDEISNASQQRVIAMLMDMGKHPAAPMEAMNLDTHWHPSFSWYGPAGIGTSRGIRGFRHCHQIPFLNAMPDRRGGYDGDGAFFADNQYVGVTGWPGMAMTLMGSNWLGLPATQQPLTMRSLDFWRLENDRIRENWVLIDLLNIWHQLGVDVLARMQALASGTPKC